jgi:hypothetical protein
MKSLKELDGTSKQTQKVVARYRKQWLDYMHATFVIIFEAEPWMKPSS